MIERIYLDSCVLNRFGDDQTQERVRFEATAAARVLDAVARGVVHWVAGSTRRSTECARLLAEN